MLRFGSLSNLSLRARTPVAIAGLGSSHASAASSRHPAVFSMFGLLRAVGACRTNKLLQVTFDPLSTFAAATVAIASNAPKLRR